MPPQKPPPTYLMYGPYLRKISPKFFPAGLFFRMLQIKCLPKCPNFQKSPLPRKIPGYAPDHQITLSKRGFRTKVKSKILGFSPQLPRAS